eukprot:550849-Prymnesium_polylepis.2
MGLVASKLGSPTHPKGSSQTVPTECKLFTDRLTSWSAFIASRVVPYSLYRSIISSNSESGVAISNGTCTTGVWSTNSLTAVASAVVSRRIARTRSAGSFRGGPVTSGLRTDFARPRPPPPAPRSPLNGSFIARTSKSQCCSTSPSLSGGVSCTISDIGTSQDETSPPQDQSARSARVPGSSQTTNVIASSLML